MRLWNQHDKGFAWRTTAPANQRPRAAAACAAAATAIALAVSGTSVKAGVIWDGGGGASASWTNPANWDNNTLPSFNGTDAISINTIGSGGTTMTLDGDYSIGSFTFNTGSTSTVNVNVGTPTSPATGTLTITSGNVTRNDFAGTVEGAHRFGGPIVLGGTAAAPSTFDVSGSNYLEFANSVGFTSAVAADRVIVKQGPGTLRFSGSSNASIPLLKVTAGTVQLQRSSDLRYIAAVDIGGGTGTANVQFTNFTYGQLGTNAPVTVRANGTMDFNGGGQTVGTVTVIDGTFGDVNTSGGFFINGNLNMTGGLVNGNGLITFLGSRTVTSNAATTSATITAPLSIANVTGGLVVADGAAALDMVVSGQVSGARALSKTGAGVLVLSSSHANGNTYAPASGTVGTTVSAGTLLVNNANKSGTGTKGVTVSGGGTLGGTGTIGGFDSTYADANVSLVGTSASVRATLDPGSIDAVTGTPTIESLTVGGAGQSNSVTFGNFSTLNADIGNVGTSDLLDVVGTLNLASAGNSDALNIRQLPATSVVAGTTYVLAEFDLLVGRFDAVTYNGSAVDPTWEIQYVGTSNGVGDQLTNGQILLYIPEPSSMALLGIGAVAFLRRRRR